MATGYEIHFGVTGAKEVFDLASAIGLTLSLDVSDPDETLTLSEFLEMKPSVDYDYESFSEELRLAYEATLDDLGWKWVNSEQNSLIDKGMYGVITPYGDRLAGPFDLSVVYDPDEMGESPDDITLGITLSSRYFPCLLDLEDSHGTIYTFVLDGETLNKIEICKKNIIKYIPEFKDANIFFRQKFY